MGLFVTFEGIDGCGKSTQINLLHKNLIDHGYSVILTREPGGTPISEKIRQIVLSTENSEMSSRCELLLYLAARAQHVEEKIKPEMDKGKIVLSDRFEEATFAYQGYGRDLGIEKILSLNTYATNGLTPDLTFILDISPEVSYKRFLSSGKVKDRLELNDIEFFNRIRMGYKKRSLENSKRIHIINGEIAIESIQQIILDEVVNLINCYQLHMRNI